MNENEHKAMMRSMMEQFFGGMGADEKKEMCSTMMGKMTEGLNMKEMMPKMVQDGSQQQMPEMMLKTMMPHCIGMMMPAVDPVKRGEVGGEILSAIVEKGSVGMSDEQIRSFLRALEEVLNPST